MNKPVKHLEGKAMSNNDNKLDFSSAKAVGMEVSHPSMGDGVIMKQGATGLRDFPVGVQFESGVRAAFTKKGYLTFRDRFPTLCVGHGVAMVNQGVIPDEPRPAENPS